MAARDPETGQFVSQNEEEVDYSSFEYQQFAIEHESNSEQGVTGSGSAEINTNAYFSFDPLAPRGGLDNSEVAELVFMEVQAAIEPEDDDGDQNIGTACEFRGVLGSGLAPTDQQLLLNLTANVEAQEVGNQQGQNINLDDSPPAPYSPGEVKADESIFLPFQSYGGLPFDNETNGFGGNASHESTVYRRNWRAITGRGPVLNSTQSIDAVTRIVAGNTIIPVTGVLRGHLVWDVSQVDDADDRFSVPG